MIATSTSAGSVRRALADEVFRRYLPAGRVHGHFARGKVLHDPVYLDLLRAGRLAGARTLLDLGCGRGILLAVVDAARRLRERGAWPGDWPAPPEPTRCIGIDASPGAVRAARVATGDAAEFRVDDLARCPIPTADTVVMLDVLHYLGRADQDALLGRVAAALADAGRVAIREADAGAGVRFALVRAAERLRAIGRGRPGQRLRYRAAGAWVEALGRAGLVATVESAGAGTPFANVLISASPRPR